MNFTSITSDAVLAAMFRERLALAREIDKELRRRGYTVTPGENYLDAPLSIEKTEVKTL